MEFTKDFDALIYIKSSLYPYLNDDESTDFLKIITNLKASAGAVIISNNKSAVFVDGRYDLAAKLSVDQNKFSIESLSIDNMIKWIRENFDPKAKLALDSRFFSCALISKFKAKLAEFVFVEVNLNNLFRTEESKRSSEIISWEFNESKFDSIYKTLNENDLDAYLVCDPCSSAWLLNQRNTRTKNVPVSLGYLLITKSKEKIFYFDDNYKEFPLKKMQNLLQDISSFSRVGVDFCEASAFIQSSQRNKNNFIDVKNPISNIKYIKTSTEIENIKKATIEDSEALVNFLFWFYCNDNISELDCVNQILSYRKRSSNFIGNSFDTIAAADENSAIVHYSPTKITNKKIKSFLLLDSGGQYRFGTTDITRTLAKKQPTKQEKLYYTLVLKGHIAVARSVVSKGSNTQELDKAARKFLQEYSLDYDHSTGHGIGYMLNVHEGPVGISKRNIVPLEANILLSNEPGVYIEGHMGVRLENMIVTEEKNGFIHFNTISLVPFDHQLIDYYLLTEEEKSWLRSYNEKILDTLSLSSEIKNWLVK